MHSAVEAPYPLRDRLRPWHALMLVVFLVGSAGSLHRADTITAGTTLRAVLSGLFGLVLFQFTVGNGWGYAVEYHDTGGEWTDLPFLIPLVVAAVAGVAVTTQIESVGLGAWGAFWAFVVVAAVVALGVRIAAGYRGAGAR